MFPSTSSNLRGAQAGTLKNYGMQAPKGLSFHLFKGPTVSSQPFAATGHFDVGYYPAADMSQRKPRPDWYAARSQTPAPPAPKMYSAPRNYQNAQYANSGNIPTSNTRGPEPNHTKQRSANFSIYPSVGKDTFIYEASDIYSNSEFSSSTTTLTPSESVFSPALSNDSTLTLQSPLVAPTPVDARPTRPPSRSSTPALHRDSSFPLHIPALAQAQTALRGLFTNTGSSGHREDLNASASAERGSFPSWGGEDPNAPPDNEYPDFDVDLDPISRRNTELNASTSYQRVSPRSKRDSLSAPMHHSQAANSRYVPPDVEAAPAQPERVFDDDLALRTSPEHFESMADDRIPASVPTHGHGSHGDSADVSRPAPNAAHTAEGNRSVTAPRMAPSISHDSQSTNDFSILQPPSSQSNSSSERRRTYASVVMSPSPEPRAETASAPPPRSSSSTTSTTLDVSGSQHRTSPILPPTQPRYEHEVSTASTNLTSERSGNAESPQHQIYASGPTVQTASMSSSAQPQIQATTRVPSQAQSSSVDMNGISFPDSRGYDHRPLTATHESAHSSQSYTSVPGSSPSDHVRMRVPSAAPSLAVSAQARVEVLPQPLQEQTSRGRSNTPGIAAHVEDARLLDAMPRATNPQVSRRPSISAQTRSSSNSPPTHFQPTSIIPPRDSDYATMAAQATAAQEARARTFSTTSVTTGRPHASAGFTDSKALPHINTVPVSVSERSSPPQARASVNRTPVTYPPPPQSRAAPQSVPPRSHTPFGEPRRRHSDDDNPSFSDATRRSATPFRTEFVPSMSASMSASNSNNIGRRPEPQRSSSDGDRPPMGPNVTVTASATVTATRTVRWNENLICPSPIFPEQRRKGWFNRRGDQLWTNSGYFKSPAPGHEYPLDLDEYPEYGQGWMNEQGVRIDMAHRLIPKPPLRSALKRSTVLHC